jgi:hypothetical protein
MGLGMSCLLGTARFLFRSEIKGRLVLAKRYAVSLRYRRRLAPDLRCPSESCLMTNPIALRWPAYILGFGMGGFFNGILLHQVLQWHYLLSSVRSAAVQGELENDTTAPFQGFSPQRGMRGTGGA